MKLSVGTNFDEKLILGMKNTAVSVIYGKLHDDVIGGGRPAFLLPHVSRHDIEQHVQLAHANGLEFNYLLNTACMGNQETLQATNKQIFELLDWLKAIKVDWVTVVFPYFVEVIKSYAPDIKVSLSTFAGVDTLQKALKYDRMGVEQITLPESVNRNFSLLEIFKKKLSCDIQVIATNTCLASCPYRNAHTNFLSHASRADNNPINHCMLRCTYDSVVEPSELIKSPWIRPEDLHYYENIGIDNFKITSRMMTTNKLLRVVHAYTNRSYKGDLGDILNFRVKTDFLPPNKDVIKKMMSSIPKSAGLVKKINELIFAREIRIDNSKLGDFLHPFAVGRKNCAELVCGKDCTYCDAVAEKALIYDAEYNQILANKLASIFASMANGRIYESEREISWPEAIEKAFKDIIAYFFVMPKLENVKTPIRLRAEYYATQDNRRAVQMSDVIQAVSKELSTTDERKLREYTQKHISENQSNIDGG